MNVPSVSKRLLWNAQADGQAGHAEAPAAKRQRTGEPPAGINGQESSKELGQRWKPADLAEGQVRKYPCLP